MGNPEGPPRHADSQGLTARRQRLLARLPAPVEDTGLLEAALARALARIRATRAVTLSVEDCHARGADPRWPVEDE